MFCLSRGPGGHFAPGIHFIMSQREAYSLQTVEAVPRPREQAPSLGTCHLDSWGGPLWKGMSLEDTAKDRHASAPALGSLFPAFENEPQLFIFLHVSPMCPCRQHWPRRSGCLTTLTVQLRESACSGHCAGVGVTDPHPPSGPPTAASCQQGRPEGKPTCASSGEKKDRGKAGFAEKPVL